MVVDMRKMKDSGNLLIGAIPAKWGICRLKNVCKGFSNGSTDTQISYGETDYPVTRIETISTGVIDYSKVGYVERTSERYKLNKNDFLISNINSIANLGNSAIYDGTSKLYHGMNLMRLVPKAVYAKFLYYWLKSYCFRIGMQIICKPAINQASVSATNMKNLSIVSLSFEEQIRIANYLDSKCAEIDALSADIQSEIETLEAYKRSVITEAVTKGLNPDVEMKDSGTPWCPQIPIHWQYTNPKALFFQRFDRAINGERQLTASQEFGIIYQDEYMEMTGNSVVTVSKDFSILKHVEPGDFVISMRSFQGGFEYSQIRGCISSAYVMLIPNRKLVYPPFFRWFFKSSKYINAIQSTSNLIRDGQAMRYANFAQVPLFIIPLDEQKEIADYLDKKCHEIDIIIKQKKEQLELLDDYKKSLIYEYVTGKKEVPAT